jgi:putative ABC transport system permease protein
MLKNYFKLAWKVMMRNKLFTLISLFGICFTLLFLILITAVVDYTVGPVEPETRLGRTLSVTMGTLYTESGSNTMGPLFSPWFFNKYVKTLQTPEVVSMSSYYNPNVLYHNEKKIKFGIKYTDAEFWQINDFSFIDGSPFTSQEVEAREPVAVISRSLQDAYFDGQDAIGDIFEFQQTRYRVVGVVENVSILRIMPFADIWVPMHFAPVDLDRPTLVGGFPGWYASVMARSKKDFPAIKAEFQQKLKHIEFPEGRYVRILTNVSSYQEALARQIFGREDGNIGMFMLIIFGLITVFMLLPAINLININTSRIYERASEIGIRKAYGASSIVLVWQFLVENIIITVFGGLLSILLAAIILSLFNSSGILADTQFTINYRVFGTGMIFAVFFGILSGVYPAFRMSRMHPAEALTGGEK